MTTFKNALLLTAVAAQDFAALPASFSSEVIVNYHYPTSPAADQISSGSRRNPGACFFTDKNEKRDSTEYWVLNGERTGDSFGNDCHDFEFSIQADGTYSIHLRDTPFFDDEFWNAGYLAMQTQSVDEYSGGKGYYMSISTNLMTTWKLHLIESGAGAGGYKMEAYNAG